MTTNFLITTFSSTLANTYRESGFLPYLTLEEVFNNKFTDISGDKLQVRSIIFEDISRIINSVNGAPNNTDIKNEKYNMLFVCNGDYVLASSANIHVLWHIRANTGGIHDEGRGQSGIRAIVSLKSNISTSGMDLNGFWNIEI